MFIVKKQGVNLLIDDLLKNVHIDTQIHTINISYTNGGVDNFFDDSIGFIQTSDWDYCKEFIEYLNQYNFTALIWIGHIQPDLNIFSYGSNNLPLHLNRKLCCVYEGEFEFLQKNKEFTVESFLEDLHENPLDSIKSCGSVFPLLEKIVDFKDTLVYMDNTGEIKNIKNYCNYTDNGIIYCSYKTYKKPSEPLIINQPIVPPKEDKSIYDQYCMC